MSTTPIDHCEVKVAMTDLVMSLSNQMARPLGRLTPKFITTARGTAPQLFGSSRLTSALSLPITVLVRQLI